MYHFVVRRVVRTFYSKFNSGDYEGIVAHYARYLPYGQTFAGTHAVGGTRHSSAKARLWFKRLFGLFPGLHVEIKEILVKGWPWNTVVAVEWVDEGQCADGQPYRNEGIQMVRLRWGRIVGVHFHLDTQRVAEACARMARNGLDEANAPPIED